MTRDRLIRSIPLRRLAPFIAASLVIFAAVAHAADTVTLRGGSTLKGKISRLDADGVTVRLADGVPALDLKWNQIEDLKTEGPVLLGTSSGDRVVGRIAGYREGALQVVTAHFGQIAAPVADLAPPPAAGEAAAADLEEALKSFAGVLEKEPAPKTLLEPKDWKGKIRLSADFLSGNTDSTLIDFVVQAERVWEREKLSASLRVRYGETEGETTAAYGAFASKFEHHFEESLYGFAKLELSRDEVQDIDFRALLTLGVGVTLWEETPKEMLSLEFGLGLFYEDFASSGRSELDPSFSFGLEYRDVIAEDLEFVESLEIVFPVTDPADFLARNKASLVYPLGENLALHNTIEVIYQNDPPRGTEELDVILSVGVEYRF